MPSSLTGDFDAALQVSGKTLNRLLASMHQNAFVDQTRPSMPHITQVELGSRYPVGGVRGVLTAQVGVPRVTLLHQSNDRFHLEVAVRAEFAPEAGSSPLPRYICGNVHADYRLVDIDPKCPGWAKLASRHLWIRVVRDSVRFDGDWADEHGPLDYTAAVLAAAEDEATIRDRIARQIANLLAIDFDPTPHPVSASFRRGAVMSLVSGGESAVVLAAQGAGDLATVGSIFLGGADHAVAFALGPIMAAVEPSLNAVRTLTVQRAGYTGRITSLTTEWKPQGTWAVITVRAHGQATTEAITADATFDVVQDIHVTFDSGTESVRLTRGAGSVTARAAGIGHGTVSSIVSSAVRDRLGPEVDGACNKANTELAKLAGVKQPLVEQLRTIDALASAYYASASFHADAIVLHGVVDLSARRRPEVVFEPTGAKNAHTALRSWIPGGRIDSFEWSWRFFRTQPATTANTRLQYLLRRPAAQTGKWGLAVGGETPLPGLDGSGSVCLTIKGVVVDPVTGDLRRIETRQVCRRFGFSLTDRITARLSVLDEPELSQEVPFPQLAVRAAGAARTASTNTLVVGLHGEWDEHTETTLREALELCRRDDAGLVTLLLFGRGQLARGGKLAMAAAEAMSTELGAAIVVNEDAAGDWAEAFGLQPEFAAPSWRLLSPAGGVTWSRDGRLTGEALAAVLEEGLFVSATPTPGPIEPGVSVGDSVVGAFDRSIVELIEEIETHCPAPPLGRLGVATQVGFVRAASETTLAWLEARVAQQGEDAPLLFVVVDGDDDGHTVQALMDRFGESVQVVPDPTGRITDRFGVATWPFSVGVDPHGRVTAVGDGPSGDGQPFEDLGIVEEDQL